MPLASSCGASLPITASASFHVKVISLCDRLAVPHSVVLSIYVVQDQETIAVTVGMQMGFVSSNCLVADGA